jgi:molybdopterin molybdotransferase
MISVEEALRLVEELVLPLAPRRVQLNESAGLILAERVVSEVNSPPHDKTLMDGYAVVSGDRAVERTVIEEIGAGTVPRRAVTPGTATRLMTGAPVPEGADAIIPVEKTEMVADNVVRFLDLDVNSGEHILRQGASTKVGDVVLEAGVALRPIEIGILAEVGHGLPLVQPRPRVAVLPTGNELVSIGERPAPGQIRNSNGPMLVASAARDGADATELPIASDDVSILRQLISEGLAADVLVLSGGVSAGKFDLVPNVLGALDVRMAFHKIALRPGKPLWFGVREAGGHRTLVFGLPGNPVSSLVCYELFVRPTIAALAGRGFAGPPSARATLGHEFNYKGGRASCLPARISRRTCSAAISSHDGGETLATVEILPWHGSADLAALGHANALVRLGTEPVQLPAGSTVDVLCL